MESVKLIPALTILVVLTSTLGVTQGFAYEITYEQWGSLLKKNPTVCAIKPSYDGLEKWELERFMKQSRLSSDEWEIKLKENQKNPELWEINYVEKSENEKTSDCTITIQFLPKAEDENFEHGLSYNPTLPLLGIRRNEKKYVHTKTCT